MTPTVQPSLTFSILSTRQHSNFASMPVDDVKLRPPIFKFTLKIKAKIVFFKGKITYI